MNEEIRLGYYMNMMMMMIYGMELIGYSSIHT